MEDNELEEACIKLQPQIITHFGHSLKKVKYCLQNDLKRLSQGCSTPLDYTGVAGIMYPTPVGT